MVLPHGKSLKVVFLVTFQSCKIPAISGKHQLNTHSPPFREKVIIAIFAFKIKTGHKQQLTVRSMSICSMCAQIVKKQFYFLLRI